MSPIPTKKSVEEGKSLSLSPVSAIDTPAKSLASTSATKSTQVAPDRLESAGLVGNAQGAQGEDGTTATTSDDTEPAAGSTSGMISNSACSSESRQSSYHHGDNRSWTYFDDSLSDDNSSFDTDTDTDTDDESSSDSQLRTPPREKKLASHSGDKRKRPITHHHGIPLSVILAPERDYGSGASWERAGRRPVNGSKRIESLAKRFERVDLGSEQTLGEEGFSDRTGMVSRLTARCGTERGVDSDGDSESGSDIESESDDDVVICLEAS